MTYSNDDIKKYGLAVVEGTIYEHFENEGWKNVGVAFDVNSYSYDSFGFPTPIIDSSLDLTAEMINPIITFVANDSAGNPITWNMTHEGKYRNTSALVTRLHIGNSTTLIPRKLKQDPTTRDLRDDFARDVHLRFKTANPPSFYYGVGDAPMGCVFDSNGQKTYDPDLEFKIEYDGSTAMITDYNHRKIFDLVQMGIPKINFFRTTPSGFDRPTNGPPTAAEFSSTGNYMLLLTSDRVTGYDLSEPYNIRTAGTDTPTPFNFSPNLIQSGTGVVMNSNGTLMMVLDKNTKKVYEFDVDTPNTIDTSQFRANFYNNVYNEIGFKSKLSSDGKYLYSICYGNNRNTELKRFNLTEDRRVSTSSFRPDQTNNLPNDYDYYVFAGYPNWSERNIRGAHYTYYWQSPPGQGKAYEHYGPVRDFFITNNGQFFFTITQAASIHGEIKKYEMAPNWSIRSADLPLRQTITHFIGATAPEDFERNQKENGPRAIAFNNDGTRMFILDTFTKSVMQYNLSVAYDLGSINSFNQIAGVDKTIEPVMGHDGQLLLTNIPATASTPPANLVPNHPQDVTFNQSVFQDFSLIRSMQFNGKGSRLFISNDHKIYEYTLTIDFDITTATFNRSFSTYQTSLENKEGCGNFHFDSNGGQLYISSKNIIEQFKLDSNIGTGVDEFGVKVLELPNDSHSISNPMDMYLNDSDNRLYISGEDRIIKYNLSIPGEIKSATFADSFQSYDGLGLTGAGLALNDSESKAFFVGSATSNKTIFEFDLDSNLSNSTFTNRSYEIVSQNNNDNLTGIRWNPNGQEFTITGSRKEETYKTKNRFKIQTL